METAGFDVIGEVSLDTIRDMVNEKQVALPAGGDPFYLLGGPFLLELSTSIPNQSIPVTVRVFCEANLDAVARTPGCRISARLFGGSASSGQMMVAHLGGTASADVSLGFVPDQEIGAAPNRYVPAVFLPSARATLDLDAVTYSSVDSTFGPGSAYALEAGLQLAFQEWLRALPQRTIDAMGFLIVPATTSDNPGQLSAFPQLMWIDSNTLGVFGYYDASAAGGDLSRKIDSDIVQGTQEFMYIQPGTVQAQRLALVFSPRGFHHVIGCPILRNGIVRTLVAKIKLPEFIDQAHRDLFDQYLAQEEQKNLLRYWFEDPALYSKSPIDALTKAKDRVRADAEVRVEQEANQRLSVWLDGTAGQDVIAAATPPPCGTGTVQADRQEMPDPFGDVISTLRHIDVQLGNGFVSIEAQADGDLPICGSYSVTQKTSAFIGVNTFGTVTTSVKPDQAQVHISKDPVCEVAAAVLIGLFGGPVWGTVLSFIGFDIAARIGEKAIAQAIAAHPPSSPPSYSPKLPTWAMLKDVTIEPSGIRTAALVARRQRFNDSRRRVELVQTPTLRTLSETLDSPPMHVEATSWGCRAEDFAYTHSRFDSVFAVRLIAVNLPLPVTVSAWRLDMGNFSYILGTVRDTRPTWANEAATLVSPTTLLSGEVWHPEPLLKGAFTRREDVRVGCSTSNGMAWELRFDGEDGNFYARIDVDVTDGDGQEYSASTFVTVRGDEIELEPAYDAWASDCEKKLFAALKDIMDRTPPKVGQGEVAPGVAQQHAQVLVAMAVQDALRRGEPTALAQLLDAVKRVGPEVAEQVGSLPVHLNSPLLGQGPTDPVPWRADAQRGAEQRWRHARDELLAAALSLDPGVAVALNPQPIPPGYEAGWAAPLQAVQRAVHGVGGSLAVAARPPQADSPG